MRLVILLLLTGSISLFAQEDILNEKVGRAASMGQYDSVEFYCQKLARIHRSNSNWQGLLSTNIFRARNLADWGKYAEAIDIAGEVEQESEKHLGPMNFYEALAYHVIGDVELKQGEYARAIDQFLDAELILTRNPAWTPSLAGLLLSKGNTFRERGSYAQAIDNFNRAKDLFETDNDKLNAVVAQVNIAGCLVMLERYDEAIADFESGKEFLLTQVGPQHAYMSAIYNNLGAAILYQEKDYSAALAYFTKATEIKRIQLGGDNHLDVARGFFNAAWTLGEMQRWSESTASFGRSQTILKTLFPNGHPLTVWTFNRHGYFMTRQKLFEKAIALLDEAAKQNTRFVKGERFFLDKVRAVETFQFKSSAYFAWYNSSGNIKHLKEALKYILESRSAALKLGQEIQKESDRLEMSKIARHVFETGAKIAYEMFRITHDKRYLATFFEFSETGKALVLNQALAESQALKFSGVPDSLIARDREFRQYAEDFTQKLLNFDATTQPASELRDIEDALYKLSELKRFFEKDIEENYPRYFELKYKSSTASLQSLQNVIPSDATVVTYLATDSLLFVSKITKNTIDVTPVSVTPNDLERMIKGMRSGILLQHRETFVDTSSKLYGWLFPNGSPTSQNTIIIPDSKLVKIPFEALLEKMPLDDDHYASMKFLVSHTNVSYANSAQLFINLMKSGTNHAQGLLAVAPVFDNVTPEAHLRTQTWLTETDIALKAAGQSRGILGKNEMVMPLPATADEIQRLYEVFKANNKPAELILRSMANERKLKSMRLPAYQYIHLATHGFANEESPELSGVLLAQDTTQQDEDNILYMGELYNLQLNADLVTLSACETGLGKVVKGEGVIGLTRALTYAGARNILVSLWKVNDASTAEMMVSLYQNLLQKSYSQISPALREAKLTMIKDEKYSDPYYWSPFVLLGW